MEDDQNERQLRWKMTKIKEDKTTQMEYEQN